MVNKKILLTIFMVCMLLSMSVSVMAVGPRYVYGEGVNAELNPEIGFEEGLSGQPDVLKYQNREVAIEVTPEIARERVRERFQEQTMSEAQVKNVAINGEERIVYEYQVQRQAKLFNLFKTTMNTKAQIPVDTGEVYLKNPWWAGLATIKGE